MSYEILIDAKPFSFLKKLSKTAPKDFQKIEHFLNKLENTEEPLKMPNCTKLVAFNDNRYRWRLGIYRIIAIVQSGELKILQIIHIGKRNEKTYG